MARYDNYKQTYQQQHWETTLNSFIGDVGSDVDTLDDAQAGLNDLVNDWTITEDYLILGDDSPSYISANVFAVGGNKTTLFTGSKIIHAYCGTTTKMVYSTVASSSVTGATTNVSLVDNVLTSGLDYVLVVNTRDGLYPYGPGYVVARDYGTPSQSTLATAQTAIGVLNRTLVVTPGTWSFTSSMTINGNINLKVEDGVIFSIASGVTLAIDGPFVAGLYQVFDCVGTGLVIISDVTKVREASWWGVVDGGMDMNVPSQQAVNSVGVGGTGTVVFPTGAELTFSNRVTTGPTDNRKVSLFGSNTTILQETTNTNVFALRNSNTDCSGFTFGNPAGVVVSNTPAIDILNITDVGLEKLRWDTWRGQGITIRGSSIRVHGRLLWFYECAATGIVLDYSGGYFPINVRLDDLYFKSPTDPYGPGANLQTRAIHIMYGEDVYINNFLMEGTAAWDAVNYYTAGWRDGMMVGHADSTNRPTNINISNGKITGMGDDAIGYNGVGVLNIFNVEGYGSLKTAGLNSPSDDATKLNDEVNVIEMYIHDCPDGINAQNTKTLKVDAKTRIEDVDNYGIHLNQVGVVYASTFKVLGTSFKNIGKSAVKYNGEYKTAQIIGVDVVNFGYNAGGINSDEHALQILGNNPQIAYCTATSGISFINVADGVSNFIHIGNVGRLLTGYFATFPGSPSTCDRFVVSNNIGGAGTALFNNAPGASATKIYTDNFN